MKNLTSIRMPEITKNQIDKLQAKTGLNQSEIITTAIDRMYAQEIKMNAYTITKIETDPQLDPWHANTGGETYTELYIDPASQIVMITQQDEDGATPIDEWNGMKIACRIAGHPDANQAHAVLHENELIDRIIAGWSSDWDGSNMVGSLTTAASKALDELVDQLEACDANTRTLWQCDDWFSDVSDADLGITAESTDAELRIIADNLRSEALAEDVILADSVYDWLKIRQSYL